MAQKRKITANIPEDWEKKGTKIPEGKRKWEAAERPPADWFNYFFYQVIESLKDLDENAIANVNNIPEIIVNGIGARPNPDQNKKNRIFIATDNKEIFIDTGTKWQQVGADDLTAQEILSLLKSVDGAGSGLDADKLDGKDASAFAVKNHRHDNSTLSNIDWSKVINKNQGKIDWNSAKNDGFYNGHFERNIPSFFSNKAEQVGLFIGHDGNDGAQLTASLNNQELGFRRLIKNNWGTWHRLWHSGNDGAGSGLDADKLDGKNASDFAAKNHNHDSRYYTKNNVDQKFGKINNLSGDIDKTQQEMAKLNHLQEEARAEIVREMAHSGVLDYNSISDNGNSKRVGDIQVISKRQFDSRHTNRVFLGKSRVLINGYMLNISHNSSYNIIDLPEPPIEGERDDLVFLEAWQEELPLGASSKREWKWRIRTVAGVDFEKYPEGFRIRNQHWNIEEQITAQGGNTAPIKVGAVAGIILTDARDKKINDAGLYVAGHGDQKSKDLLKTANGYVYAIPLFRVKRRNSMGYSETNPNGAREYLALEAGGFSINEYTMQFKEWQSAEIIKDWQNHIGDYFTDTNSSGFTHAKVISVNVNNKTVTFDKPFITGSSGGRKFYIDSDRPDGLYANIIDKRDIIDLRHYVSLNDFNYQQLLEENFDKLLRGELQTKEKEQMVKTYHGIRKTPIDSNTVFYASFDGSVKAEVGGEPIETNIVNPSYKPTWQGKGILTSSLNQKIVYNISGLNDNDKITIDFTIQDFYVSGYPEFLRFLDNQGNDIFYLWASNQTKTIKFNTSSGNILLKNIDKYYGDDCYFRFIIDKSNNNVQLYLNGILKSNITMNNSSSVGDLSNIVKIAINNNNSSDSFGKWWSDLSISNINRGNTFATLPPDFISGHARIAPALSNQRRNLSDAEIIQPTTAFAYGENKGNSRGVTVKQRTANRWSRGDKIIVTGRAGETISSHSAPKVRFKDNNTIKNVAGTWSGLGTTTAIFTLSSTPGMTNQKLEINYDLECPRGNGGLPEVYTKTLAGEYQGKTLKRGTIAVVDDFRGKIKGSTVENPNKAYDTWQTNNESKSLLNPINLNPNREIATSNYRHLENLNDTLVSCIAKNKDSIPQQLFSFNLIRIIEDKFGEIPALDKAQWLKDNIETIIFNWWGYGERTDKSNNVIDNHIMINVWWNDTNNWKYSEYADHHFKNYVSRIKFKDVNILQPYVNDNGHVYFIVYNNPVSVEGGKSIVHTDYVNIEIQLKGEAGYDMLVPANPRRDEEQNSNVLLVRKETKEIYDKFGFGSRDEDSRIITWGDYVPKQSYKEISPSERLNILNGLKGFSTSLGTGGMEFYKDYPKLLFGVNNRPRSYNLYYIRDVNLNLDLSNYKGDSIIQVNDEKVSKYSYWIPLYTVFSKNLKIDVNSYRGRLPYYTNVVSGMKNVHIGYDKVISTNANYKLNTDDSMVTGIYGLIELCGELYLYMYMDNSCRLRIPIKKWTGKIFKLQGRPLIKGGNN